MQVFVSCVISKLILLRDLNLIFNLENAIFRNKILIFFFWMMSQICACIRCLCVSFPSFFFFLHFNTMFYSMCDLHVILIIFIQWTWMVCLLICMFLMLVGAPSWFTLFLNDYNYDWWVICMWFTFNCFWIMIVCGVSFVQKCNLCNVCACSSI